MASGNAVVLYAGSQGGRATVLVTGANGTIQVAANSSGANSDLGNPAANDAIVSASIESVWWTANGGSISILRGSNTVLTLSYTGQWLQSDGWPGCNLYNAAPLTVNFPSGIGANGTVYIVLKKEYAGGDGVYYTGA